MTTNESLDHIAEPLRGLAVAIDTLRPDPANARVHSDRNIETIVASLDRWGQRSPIVVQKEGMVVRAGNGRVDAAKRLGWKHIAAVIVDEESVEATAFAIADNRSSELGAWSDESLAALLGSLGPDLSEIAGFSETDLDELLADLTPGVEVVEDAVPEVQVEAVTQVGDLWSLGSHRVLCGDAINAGHAALLMDGLRADLMLTDPPYNVAYTGKTSDALTIANDSMSDEDFRRFLASACGVAFDSLKPGASFYIWHADSEGYNFRGAVHDCHQRVRQCLVWKKQTLVMGRQDYQWMHEPCLYGWKDGASHGWYSDRCQTTVLEFDRPSRSEDHPTMKPVALFAYLIGNSTAPQGVVYDPFLGSGTSLIAAEQLGRICYGIEISPQYVDVIIKRWQQLTGRKATRVGADGTACEGMPALEAAID